jgi:hypothetical protein
MVRTFAAAACLYVVVPIAAAHPQDASKPAESARNAGSSASPSSSNANSAKSKAKKEWTNDNLPNSGEGISVVGSASSGRTGGSSSKSQPKGSPVPRDSIDPKVVASLRDQLRRLEAQLAVVEKQYSDLKAQSKGDSKSAGGLQQNTYMYDSSSVEEQLQHLQEKKKRIQSTIDELLDAARKAGIEPGDLR